VEGTTTTDHHDDDTTDSTHAIEDLSDDDIAFMTGSFGQDLGIDFFGFKELGIDIDHVPTITSRRQLKRQQMTVSSNIRTSDHSTTTGPLSKSPSTRLEPLPATECYFTPPSPFTLINDPALHIGLMQSFLRGRLEAAAGQLIEDEFLPSKPKLSGKKRHYLSGNTTSPLEHEYSSPRPIRSRTTAAHVKDKSSIQATRLGGKRKHLA
jgi:transcriptional activator SPT7